MMSERTDRWRRVEQICQDALDRPLAERAAFLGAACGEDAPLRHEVEALLRQEEAGSAFLESPTGAVAAAVLEPGASRLSGHRVGGFDVGPLLGAGGMGEVYRARDTRLDRDVAIKILPEAFAHDAERVARFQREAKTLASLNHPNIARHLRARRERRRDRPRDGARSTATISSQRIARGAISLDEALPIAKQIAEALAAAHEHGIIHRDLKPANIKVRRDGVVKVLDFGLAKAMEPAGVRTRAYGQPHDHHAGDDTGGDDPGHGSVHGARTGAWAARGQASRHLGIRRGAVRDARRPAPFRR